MLAAGCGKADRYQVESAIQSSIYEDRTFFETLCGFPLASSRSAQVQIVEAEGDALPWFGLVGNRPTPGTARLRLTGVVRKGDTRETVCEGRVGFLWYETKQAVVEQNRKYVRSSSTFHARDFRKLGP